MNYLLDTHTWIWLSSAPEALSSSATKLLAGRGRSNRFLLSAISIVELTTLVEKRRINLLVSHDEWVRAALDQANLRLVPVTHEIALETGRLTGFDHYDPADRIIVATARVENATIVTADRILHSYGRVKTLW